MPSLAIFASQQSAFAAYDDDEDDYGDDDDDDDDPDRIDVVRATHPAEAALRS
jgi:hypothetical protein